MSYTIFYDSTNTNLKGYQPAGKKFRVHTKRFCVRVSVYVPTEIEALAILQHLRTLSNATEVSNFVADLKGGGIRIVDETSTVVDENVDVLPEGNLNFDEMPEEVEIDDSEPSLIVKESHTWSEAEVEVAELRSKVASLNLKDVDKDAEITKLRSEIASLNLKITELTLKETTDEPYKTKFEFLENVTGGVQKFTDLKNSFFKRLKFLFFPNKY